MKRILIAVLLATALLATGCVSPEPQASEENPVSGYKLYLKVSGYKVYVIGETARFDKESGKCLDMKGNLLLGKAGLEGGRGHVILCADGEITTEMDYHESGQLAGLTPYKNGVKHGISTSYDRFGSRRYEIPYKNGKIEGVKRTFDEYYGGPKEEIPYKNDVVDGIAKIYESRRLKEETPFKNGIVDGISKAYYESGAPRYVIPFKNGVKDGIEKFYYENGKLSQESVWKNGAKEGETKLFRRNGAISAVVTHKKDKAISGVCHLTNGQKVPLTGVELENWNRGRSITCD
ncbi:MAG: toxin-antitoxin system YwqK family antitoxin [Helicobacteraceae bacterium]|jgi:antitoxin component YwqK of YwqJK toxin-antitoxin module|nr:toxin-antitoxin system YwqK family antitoxin [Helicobacteraceae bacterium]